MIHNPISIEHLGFVSSVPPTQSIEIFVTLIEKVLNVRVCPKN